MHQAIALHATRSRHAVILTGHACTFMCAGNSPETDMETPCIKVCVIEPDTQVCTGCRRTLTEIARWSQLSPAERRRIMTELPGRQASAPTQGAR
jgi:uncharacterized protein